jgi:CheY-like chemotaxis protein
MSSVVVIEEDKLMQALLVEWLGADGYAVRSAEPGEPTGSDRADLVIVDVYMPRHEGAKRLSQVKAAYPQALLIAISGQFRAGLAGPCATAEALGVQQVIAKPFSQSDLLAAVHQVIGAAR